MSDDQTESPESIEAFGLMVRLFEDDLDQVGVVRLDMMICQHADIRLKYIQLSHQYCTLMPLIAGIAAEAENAAEADEAIAEASAKIELPKPQPQMPRIGREKWWALGIVSTAALVLFGFALTWVLMRSPENNATLISGVDAAWNVDLQEGHALPSGPVTLRSGLAKIQMKDGTMVIVESPATFQINGPDDAEIKSGSLTATVPISAHGFAILTPSARVVDLGTEFGVAVNADHSTLISVFRGKVETTTVHAASTPDVPKTTLVAGQAVQVTPSGDAVTPATITPAAFVRRNELDDRIAEMKESPSTRWRTYSYQLRHDPSLLAYYSFDKRNESATTVVNDAATGSSFDAVIGSDSGTQPARTAGRWADKSALVMKSEALQYLQIPSTSALDFSTSAGPARPLTIVVWIKPEIQQASDVSIFTYGKGLREQYAIGVWAGHFRSYIRADNKNFGVNCNGPAVAAGWHQLVLTINPPEKTMTFYYDGSPASQAAIPDTLIATPPVPGLLGARIDRNGKFIPGFNGAVDELAIFSRAMSADEVHSLYDAEKP